MITLVLASQFWKSLQSQAQVLSHHFLLYKKCMTRFHWVKPKVTDHRQVYVQVLQRVYTIKNNSSSWLNLGLIITTFYVSGWCRGSGPKWFLILLQFPSDMWFALLLAWPKSFAARRLYIETQHKIFKIRLYLKFFTVYFKLEFLCFLN